MTKSGAGHRAARHSRLLASARIPSHNPLRRTLLHVSGTRDERAQRLVRWTGVSPTAESHPKLLRDETTRRHTDPGPHAALRSTVPEPHVPPLGRARHPIPIRADDVRRNARPGPTSGSHPRAECLECCLGNPSSRFPSGEERTLVGWVECVHARCCFSSDGRRSLWM